MVTTDGVPSARRHVVLARITLGNAARQDGDLDEAARAFDAARGDLDLVPFPESVFGAMLETGMGHLAIAADDLEAAGRHLETGLALALEAPDMPLVALVSVGVARLALRRGSPDEAAEVLGAAHALRGAPDAFNPDVTRLAEDLRCTLGERAYEAAYAAGRGLDRAGALARVEAQVRRR